MNKTTGPLLIEEEKERELIFKMWNSKLPIMIHAMGQTIKIAIKLAKKFKKNIHVCHVTADQLDLLKKAKKEGIHVTSEVCPHHLFLNKNSIKKLGSLGMMQPPLLTKHDQEKLWDNLDQIDMISTDHAPHTLEEKHDLTFPKFGVPGLETTLPLMLDAVSKGLITLERLIEMTITNPKRIFHLPIQPNTFVEIDLSEKYKISNKDLFTKCAWTPFAKLQGRGKVKKVVIRDKTVFRNGKFVGKPQGRVVYPIL